MNSKHDLIHVSLPRKKVMMLALFVGVWVVGISYAPDAIKKHIAKQQIERHHQEMVNLANEGKEQAAIWLIEKYPLENLPRLAALAATNNVQAMYYQGRYQVSLGKQGEGITLIRRAAGEGYWPAIQYLARKEWPNK